MASQVQIPFEGVILQEHSAPISCPTPNFAKGSHVYTNWHFFDVGLVNELAHRGTLKPGSFEYGAAFEHFIFMELRAYTSYKGGRPSITYWRTSSGFEVDFVLGDATLAVEVKSTDNPTRDHMKGLRAWKTEHKDSRCLLVCRAPRPRMTEDDIGIMPWQSFLNRLWSGELC